MRVWTVAPETGESCGYCGVRIAKDQPMQKVYLSDSPSAQPRFRCVEHADGPVDQAQIDAAKLARDAAKRAPVQAPLRTHSRSARDGFVPLKAVIPFDELPEHVQRTHARAAGDGPDR
jgi:hypothetical protein